MGQCARVAKYERGALCIIRYSSIDGPFCFKRLILRSFLILGILRSRCLAFICIFGNYSSAEFCYWRLVSTEAIRIRLRSGINLSYRKRACSSYSWLMLNLGLVIRCGDKSRSLGEFTCFFIRAFKLQEERTNSSVSSSPLLACHSCFAEM
ncbi:hypothetical protein BDZ89DRAFT_305095 [Hymenopellis radicata]|nr:hypothetical protein BDZ89DRAFT_305095 [Hymenopellis radicata]